MAAKIAVKPPISIPRISRMISHRIMRQKATMMATTILVTCGFSASSHLFVCLFSLESSRKDLFDDPDYNAANNINQDCPQDAKSNFDSNVTNVR